MDLSIVAMMLAAALLHSLWHALVKAGGDQISSLAGMNVVSTTVALLALPLVALPKDAVWPLLGLSIILHVTYKLGLAKLYQFGALSHTYPIARGLSPIFATLIALAVLDEVPGPSQLTGTAVICLGLLGLALERRSGGLNRAQLAAAAVTGVAVASYSVVDGQGTRLNGDWLSFTVWLMALDGGAFLMVASALRGRPLWVRIVTGWRHTLTAGLLGVASFSVFLWALSRGPVGGVSALRETSVLFVSLIGMLALGEPRSPKRLAGALLVLAGILILAARPF